MKTNMLRLISLILVVLMPYAAWIPMPIIAAILFMVAYNMSEWKKFVHTLKSAPKNDIIVMVITFGLTVIFDLVVAIEVGMILAALLFMSRMANTTEVRKWEEYDEEKVLEDCFEAGAADVSFEDEGIIEVTTEPSDLASVADALEGMGYELKQREAAMVPNNYTRVDDEDTLKKLALLFDNLEEDDDVQNVWNNLENSEDLPEL